MAASDRGDDVPFGLRNHHGGSLDEDDEAALRCDEFLCISAPPETTPAPARAPHRMVVAAYKSGAANLAYLPPIPSLEDVPSMAHAVAPSPARPCEAQREAPIAIYSAPEPRMLDRDHLMKSASECAHEPVDLDFVNTPTKAAGGLCSRYARLVAAEGVAFAARLGKPHRRQKTDRADPNRIGGRRWRHVRQELQRALDDEIEAGHIAAKSAPVGKAAEVYPELHLPTAGRESLVDTHLVDTAERGRAQLDSAEDCAQACGLRSCNKPSVAPATRLYLHETLSMVKPEAESNLKPQPKRQRAYSAVTAPPTRNSTPEAKPTAKPDGGQDNRHIRRRTNLPLSASTSTQGHAQDAEAAKKDEQEAVVKQKATKADAEAAAKKKAETEAAAKQQAAAEALAKKKAETEAEAKQKAEAEQCGDQNFQGNCAISRPRWAAEARRAEAVVAKRLAQRFVSGVWSRRMY